MEARSILPVNWIRSLPPQVGQERVVELAGQKIGDIYDYTKVLETLKPDVKVKIVVTRKGKRLTFDLVPGRRG